MNPGKEASMELYQLRAFVAAADMGQITKAAQRLHITQPAVSAQIKALEQEIGVPLFERVGNGVLLTRAGQELLAHARNVIAAARTIIEEGRKLREGGCQELRLGTVMHPQFIQLGRLVSELLETFPLIQLKLQHCPSGNVIDAILDGELDAAFSLAHRHEPRLAYLPLAELEYCVVGSASCWPQLQTATLEQLCEMPWLAAPGTSTQAVLLEQLFKGRAVLPPHIVEVDQETTRFCLVLEGIGLCLMRKELAQQHRRDGKVVVWPGKGPSTTLSFVHLAERRDELVLRATTQIVTRLWNSAANTVELGAPARPADMALPYDPEDAARALG
jgi:DNA-binding transcriptional LysR family regulator